jgi:hypothetical protein
MMAVSSSELVIYQAIQGNVPEDSHHYSFLAHFYSVSASCTVIPVCECLEVWIFVCKRIYQMIDSIKKLNF